MTDLPANKTAGTTGAGRTITGLRFFRHLLRWHRGFQCLWQGIGDAVARRLANAPRLVGVLVETDFLGDVEAAVLETFFAWQQVFGTLFLAAGRHQWRQPPCLRASLSLTLAQQRIRLSE